MREKPGRLILLLLTILVLLSSCTVKDKKSKSSMSTPSPAPKTIWGAAETTLSNAILGNPGGKCEWEVLGWFEQERYIWAFCQSGPGVDAVGASQPAVVRVQANGSILSVTLPEEGEEFSTNVRRLFPPSIQEKIFAQDFDLYAAVSHLEARWRNPALPPEIFERARGSLPAIGEPSIPALSAATANRIVQQAVLGQGNIRQVQYLTNGQIILSGDRGIGLLDEENFQIDYPFQEMLEGRVGFLSADGKYLAAINDQAVNVFEVASQALKVSIDTSDVDGILSQVQFLADGLTLMVEKYVPSEGLPDRRIALYQISDGAMTAIWSPTGSNLVLSPNGYYAAGVNSTIGLQVWSLARGGIWTTLPVIARSVSFSGDGQIIAVAEVGKVKLFWVWDGFEIGRLEKDIGHIAGVALSPDGKLLLTWSDGPEPARLWTVPDFSPVATLDIQGVSSAAFSPDGTEIALAGDTIFGRYDVLKDEFSRIGLDIYSPVADLSFAPDRPYSAGQRLVVLYRPGPYHSVVLNWDTTTQTPQFVQTTGMAFDIEFLPEPYGIALGGEQGTIQLIDADDGSVKEEFKGGRFSVQDLTVHVSDTVRFAASARNEVRIFTLPASDEKNGRDVRISGGWVNSVVWPCFLAAAVDDGSIQILDEEGEKKEHSIIMPASGFEILISAPMDCSRLLAAQDKSVYPFLAGTWDTLPSWALPETIAALAVSVDGSLAAVGLMDGSIRLYEVETGKEISSLEGHAGMVNALEFSPDGSILASGGRDGVVILWGVK
ncbi:MAG: WD40 repeat domain-containing protein [Chloroflexi bacterium]|nr:MAG: WD40 repeat domain-containing protein [Chloroflexota bacterium]